MSDRDLYRLILDNVQDGIWVTGSDERLVFLDKGMERIAGVRAEDVIRAARSEGEGG